jgi:predicted TIM-barrel fold metal-dependent hydrolase
MSTSNPHVAVREDWLDSLVEPILDPDLPLVDPHHHLWDRAYYPYLEPQFSTDLQTGHRVEATVFVECRAMYRQDGQQELQPIGETTFVANLAQTHAHTKPHSTRIAAGIVGYADLTLGAAVEDVLHAHMTAGEGRFRGIRNIAAWEPTGTVKSTVYISPEKLLYDPRLREGFAKLGPLDLTFESWIYYTQIDDLTDLARAFPDTMVILDHVGGPIESGPYRSRQDEVFADWEGAIRRLATCPNAMVKLSGFGMQVFGFDFHARELPPSSEEVAMAIRPYVEACIETFGPDRCMFASNFPVDKSAYSYPVLWNAFKRLCAGYSPTERTALLHDTAAAVYRLP